MLRYASGFSLSTRHQGMTPGCKRERVTGLAWAVLARREQFRERSESALATNFMFPIPCRRILYSSDESYDAHQAPFTGIQSCHWEHILEIPRAPEKPAAAASSSLVQTRCSLQRIRVISSHPVHTTGRKPHTRSMIWTSTILLPSKQCNQSSAQAPIKKRPKFTVEDS